MSGPIETNVSGDTPSVYQGGYKSGSASVGTTATQICVVPGGYADAVLITNGGAADVFIGGSGVTTTSGFPVGAGATVQVPSGKGEQRVLYGVVASGTATVSYLQAT